MPQQHEPLPPSPIAGPSPFDVEAVLDALPDEAPPSAARELALRMAHALEHDPTRWRITDAELAEWAMRLAAEARHDLAELDAQRGEWLARLTRWYNAERARPAALQAFMDAHLEVWALGQRTDRRKRIASPSGFVQTTSTSPSLTITDEAALLDWIDQLADTEDPSDEQLSDAEAWDAVVKIERSALVSKVPAGVDMTPGVLVRYACPAQHTLVILADPDWPRPERGEVVTCEQCTERHRMEAEAAAEAEAMADWPDGDEPEMGMVVMANYPVADVAEVLLATWRSELVPGLAVKPGSVSAKVTTL